jgi:hypothetical protein
MLPNEELGKEQDAGIVFVKLILSLILLYVLFFRHGEV